MYPQPVLTLTMLPLTGKDRRRHVYLSQSGYDSLTSLCAGAAVTGPAGPTGPEGPAGVSVTVTTNVQEPIAPRAGDIWIVP